VDGTEGSTRDLDAEFEVAVWYDEVTGMLAGVAIILGFLLCISLTRSIITVASSVRLAVAAIR
jgi:hypothetical protein